MMKNKLHRRYIYSNIRHVYNTVELLCYGNVIVPLSGCVKEGRALSTVINWF